MATRGDTSSLAAGPDGGSLTSVSDVQADTLAHGDPLRRRRTSTLRAGAPGPSGSLLVSTPLPQRDGGHEPGTAPVRRRGHSPASRWEEGREPATEGMGPETVAPREGGEAVCDGGHRTDTLVTNSAADAALGDDGLGRRRGAGRAPRASREAASGETAGRPTPRAGAHQTGAGPAWRPPVRGGAGSALRASGLSLARDVAEGGGASEGGTLDDDFAATTTSVAGALVGTRAAGIPSAFAPSGTSLAEYAPETVGSLSVGLGSRPHVDRPEIRRIKAVSRIKRLYARRVTERIERARATGEVVRDQGVAVRVSTTIRALTSTTATAAGTGGGLLAALSAPVIAAVAALLLFIILIGAIAAAAGGSSQQGVSGLGPYASQMAQFLRDQGWDDVHVAAAVGNSIYESGGDFEALEIDPSHEGDLSGVANYEYEVNCGIFSWTDTSPGVGSMSQLKAYAAMQRTEWQDLDTQLSFFMTVYLAGRQSALAQWLQIEDLHEATKVFVSPTGGLLAGAQLAIESPAIDRRYDLAERVYEALTSGGGGEEYAASSEVQQAIADAARSTPSTASGWCAAWVSNVYANAGLGGVGGNAVDMYRAYCHSSSRSELKVGMLVAVQPSASYDVSPDGWAYGHVGIYVGDGIVMHSTRGQVFSTPIDEWVATYGQLAQVRWGFPPNVSI